MEWQFLFWPFQMEKVEYVPSLSVFLLKFLFYPRIHLNFNQLYQDIWLNGKWSSAFKQLGVLLLDSFRMEWEIPLWRKLGLDLSFSKFHQWNKLLDQVADSVGIFDQSSLSLLKLINTPKAKDKGNHTLWCVWIYDEKLLVFASSIFLLQNQFVWEVISNTCHSVSSQYQKPRSSSKILCYSLYFNSLLSVWYVIKHCASCLIYYISHIVPQNFPQDLQSVYFMHGQYFQEIEMNIQIPLSFVILMSSFWMKSWRFLWKFFWKRHIHWKKNQNTWEIITVNFKKLSAVM